MSAVAEGVSVALLVGVLVFAVIRPRGLPEAVAAVPAAAIVVAIGAISPQQAGAQAAHLAPVVGFLAAVLVLARMCADEGLFAAAGSVIARWCRGSPPRLLAAVFALAAATTAMLSLDATVVLLTPVVFATATRVGAMAKPQVYACTHLANTGSLLLPVSNLTNLLAFAAAGLTFAHFAALMALPWLVAIGLEYLVFRVFFADDLRSAAPPDEPLAPVRVPRWVLVILALTLAGFVVSSLIRLDPAWVAFAGAGVLAIAALARRRTTLRRIVLAANVPFLAFVLALGVVVAAVVRGGLGTAVGDLLPSGASFGSLLLLAAIAAVLANLINNLPAVLLLIPLVAGQVVAHGAGPLLAVLLGVNIGPNLTYIGSLATLLWRRVLRAHDEPPALGEFSRLGAITVPLTLVAAVVALWGALQLFGG